jgi:hypothetical protein
MSSALTITNCSAAPVDWTAATVPSVALTNAAGNLDPGSSSKLGFTIDSGAHQPGAVTFKIKVSEPGHNHYVDVHAFRELVGSDFASDLGLSAGEGAGGCANQCIVSGKLTGNYSSPNVSLDVAQVDGTWTLVVTAEDAAGNVGTASGTTVVTGC